MLKLIIKYVMKVMLHVFFILPVNRKKIFFTSFCGDFTCNPRYIYLWLREQFPNKFIYVWEFSDKSKNTEAKADRVVRHLSPRFLFEVMTSRFIITNSVFLWYIPKRKSQILINTWHGGGAYKTMGRNCEWNKSWVAQKQEMILGNKTDFFVSSCRKFTEVFSSSYFISEAKVIKSGMPRNAVLFLPERCVQLSEKARTVFSILQDTKIVLYAPTFRGAVCKKAIGSERDYGFLNFSLLKSVCEERFGGEFVVLYRAHYIDSNLKNSLPDFVIDATRYEDMQELLCAADVLVTDYSSSMWDFALTGKPCFLYVPDIDKYIAERGFYTDPATWPFPLARSEAVLHENIARFDGEKYAAAVRKHLEDLGSYENKDACRKVCEAIGVC